MERASRSQILEFAGHADLSQCGLRANRVVVVVVAGGGAVLTEQRRDGSGAVEPGGQKASGLLIGLVSHHGALGDIAVMAAQAHHDAADFLRKSSEVRLRRKSGAEGLTTGDIVAL